jgi:hypothetical protein
MILSIIRTYYLRFSSLHSLEMSFLMTPYRPARVIRYCSPCVNIYHQSLFTTKIAIETNCLEYIIFRRLYQGVQNEGLPVAKIPQRPKWNLRNRVAIIGLSRSTSHDLDRRSQVRADKWLSIPTELTYPKHRSR